MRLIVFLLCGFVLTTWLIDAKPWSANDLMLSRMQHAMKRQLMMTNARIRLRPQKIAFGGPRQAYANVADDYYDDEEEEEDEELEDELQQQLSEDGGEGGGGGAGGGHDEEDDNGDDEEGEGEDEEGEEDDEY